MISDPSLIDALLGAAQDAVVIADGDGKITHTSARAESLFGYGCGALVGRQIEELLPRRLSTAHPMIDEHLERLARRRDGSLFPVEVRPRPIQTEQGVLVMRVIRNISALCKAPTQHLLLIDASFANAKVCCETLVSVSHGGYTVEWLSSCRDALERLHRRENMPDAILIDIARPDDGELNGFAQVLQSAGKIPILILCESSAEASAKKAVRLGATDYVVKGHLHGRMLGNAVARIIEQPFDAIAFYDEREIAQMTLNSVGDAVVSCDRESRITYLNPAAETMTGWSQAEALSRPLGEVLNLIDGRNRKRTIDPMMTITAGGHSAGVSLSCLLIRRGGTELFVEYSSAPIYDRRGRSAGASVVLHDVSAAHATAARMAYLAEHDMLTGLPNRLLLSSRLPQAIAAAQRNDRQVALLFLDIDNFKQVNDSLGHRAGDTMLKSVAERLTESVRSSDTVCRLSGDEFVVLLAEIKRPSDAVICADKIIAALRLPHEFGQHRVALTASIGISVYPDDGKDAETLMSKADKAMLRAKNSGRNSSVLSESTGAFQKIDWQQAEQLVAAAAKAIAK